MIDFFKGLLGGLGIIKKELEFVKTEFADFVRGLPAPCLIFTRDRTPGFFGGGIQAVTNSVWQHVVIYIGRSLAQRVRQKHPELMGKRRFVSGNLDIELLPIPKNACLHEIIESSAFIRCGTLDEYNDKDNQMAAVIKPLTVQEAEEIAFRAYLMHGMPYDVQEIASHVTGLPNPEEGKIIFEDGTEIEVGMKVCSSYGAFAFGEPNSKQSPGSLFKDTKKWIERSVRRFNYKKHL